MKRKTLLITLMLCFAFLGIAKAQETLTVYDEGTTTNNYVPIYGLYCDEGVKCEFVIPAEQLEEMANGTISAMKFYLASVGYNSINPSFTIFIKEVDFTTMTAYTGTSDATTVFNSNFTFTSSATNVEIEVPFSENYTYKGGNLLIGVYQNGTSDYSSLAWTGVNQNYNSTWRGYGSSTGSAQQFLPKTTFTYEPAQQGGCAKPTGLAVSYTGGTTATVTWNGTASQYDIDVNGTVFSDVTSPYTLNDLKLATTYEVKVRANCGDEYSDYTSTKSFTTDACLAEDMCSINLALTDSYGDGWNGNYIEVVDVQTSTVLATFTISSGSSATGTLNVCDGREIEIKYVVPGSSTYPTENSFVITDHLGEVIWEVGQCSSSTGNMTYTVDCSVPSCFKPTDLAVNSITNESAVATWTAGDENQTSWNLQYKKTSEVKWTSVEGLSEPNYTFAHLEAGTVYEVQVQGDCRQEGLSDWTSSVTFTTALCGADDMCEIHYVCESQYESWYGAAINVVDAGTGITLATWTQNNANTGVTTGTLAVCDGRELSFQWVAGSYDSYEGVISGYAVYDVEGNEIFSGTSALTKPFTYTVKCPTCFKPTNLEATNVGAESAVLNWEGTSASYVLQYRTAAQNINMTEWHQIGEDVTATATETTYTFDLSDYEGEGYVAIRHYNVTNMYFLDVDNITVTDPDGETVLVSADGTSIPSTWTNQDVDGDGYVWSTSVITGYYVSQSYDNSVGTLTPDNWLIIPVSNLGGTLSFTAKGQDSSFPAENFGVFVTTSTLTDALQPVAAGNWSDEITTTEQSYQITGLTANTLYEWQVKGVCSTDEESAWATSTFTTIELGAKNFVTEGNWDVADNWSPVGVPTIDDKVIISANATVPAGVVATAKKITLNGGTLTIADGGQLKQNGNVELVMEKEIEAYGTSAGNYYFIASPLTTTRLTFVQDWSYVNAITGNYDLYAFDPTQELEWINYKSSSDHALFTSGQNNPVLVQQTGYLYANEEGITLQFEGTTAVKSNENVLYQELSFNAEATDSFNGWTLIGNPYTCDAYISYVDADGNALDADFYTLNLDNTYTLMTSQDGLAPCTGALISMSATGKVQYSTEAPAGKASMLDMTVTEGRGKVDQARIRFGVGYGLEKKSFRANSSSLYIPQNNKDYAVVYAENTGEMPVNFKAENNGNYTINFSNEEVEFSYLHLIDNLTGADVDLLANPSYNFEAKTTDYTSRFKLVFATGNSVNGNDFGFISNNHLKIFGIEGNATVKVMDITGRTLSTENFNGSYDKQLNLSAGVYMIQLIQGNDVKTQKIVIK